MEYDEIIERSQKPIFFGKIDGAVESEEENAICGDHIKIYLLVENNRIKDAKFSGKGCSISFTSADLIIEKAIGKSIDEVLKWDENFVRELIGIPLGINRIKCALLPLNVLKSAILKNKNTKS
ncbi:MAG: iron-sulfur cluster assembly scaffold protein [Candidatus Woesearchaeota archaeon]